MSSTPIVPMNEPPSGGRLAQGDSAPTGHPPEAARGPGGRFAPKGGLLEKPVPVASKPVGKDKAKHIAPRFEVNNDTGGIRRVEQFAAVELKAAPERAKDGKFGKGAGTSRPSKRQKTRARKREANAAKERARVEGIQKDKGSAEKAPPGVTSSSADEGPLAPAMTVDPTTPLETPADLNTSRAATTFAAPRFVHAPLPAFQPVARPQGVVTPMVAPRVIVGR